MKSIVGQAHNKLVCNRANSSGKGPAHLENTKGRLTINIVCWHFSQLTCLKQAHAHQLVEKHQVTWKRVKEKIS